MRRAASVAIVAALSSCAVAEPPNDGRLRVMSLDGCADQYVLALAPDAELALSPRADDPDSHMREAAKGRRRVRPTLESVVGFRPDVVVRQWGGDARLMDALRRRGVRVIEIGDAADLDDIRANTVRVGAELGRPQAAASLTARMDDDLARARRAADDDARGVYITAAGWTAGPDTLVDAVMRAGGLRNATAAPGYGALKLEALALDPPDRFVLGFFDRAGSDRFGVGRHPVVTDAMSRGEAVELPSAQIACPGWFTAQAAVRLAG